MDRLAAKVIWWATLATWILLGLAIALSGPPADR